MTPHITSFYPLTGFPGEKINIYGSGFTGVTLVKFGTYPALTFRVVSDTNIEAYLGIDGDSLVSLTNSDGTGSLGGFTQQKIKKNIAQFPALGRPAVANDKVLLWADAEAATRYALVSDLPAGSGGSGGGGTGGGGSLITVPSPFMVFSTSANYSYDDASGNSKIKDARLLNLTGYPVATTQFGGGEFNVDVLTYNAVDPDDSTKGNVIIKGFKLDPNAHITITTPGSRDASTDAIIAKLIADVEQLRQISAPLAPTALGANGAKLWWVRPISEIPAGWQICTLMKGVMPFAQDPDNDTFKTIGSTGGSATHTNTVEEMAPHAHDFTIPSRDLANVGNSGPDLSKDGEGDTQDFTTKTAGGYLPDGGATVKVAKPYSIMNPYRVGVWIEYIGI